MTRARVIDAIRTQHPWVSVERCEDLMDRAKEVLGHFALPMECGRWVLGSLEATEFAYGTPRPWKNEDSGR